MPLVDSTLRGRTTQKLILQAFVARLIADIDDYNSQNCFVSDQPVPPQFIGGRSFCTVSPGSGRFPQEFFGGAGDHTLVEDASVIITPGMARKLDKPHKRDAVILNLSDSLVQRKHDILQSLFGEIWEPADGDQPLLRDLPSPVSVTAPADVRVGETDMIALQITVATVFDWDLSGGVV